MGASITCLRDYGHALERGPSSEHGLTSQAIARLHAPGARGGFRCFYCGERATTIDHLGPRVRAARGVHGARNIRPACGRCNARKHKRGLEEFRAFVARVAAVALGKRAPARIVFFGEQHKGAFPTATEARRLREILSTAIVNGKPVLVAPGEPWPTSRPGREKATTPPKPACCQGYWGQRTIIYFTRAAKCSQPTVRRYLAGIKVTATTARAMRAAIAAAPPEIARHLKVTGLCP